MRRFWPWTMLLLGGWLLIYGGCGSRTNTSPAANTTAGDVASSEPKQTDQSTEGSEPQELPALEPFDPPPLEELNAKAEWVDRPVRDAMKLRREYDAAHPAPISVKEALALKNTSAQNNQKILLTLGKLPTDDNQVNWDATINRRLTMDVKRTNPLFFSSISESEVSSLIGFGIFSIDWNLEPFAAAEHVTEWKTSKDGMYDMVVLRDDLTWSDGHPITAHDVAFTFQVIMDSKVGPYIPAIRSGTDELRWVHAYDDRTIVFFHKEPMATNVWNIMFPVIPQHIYKDTYQDDPQMSTTEYHRQQELNPVSGGAYKIVKRDRGQEIVLEAREDYYMFKGKQVREKPYIKRVRFKIVEDNNTALLALEKGDLDESLLGAAQWQAQTNSDAFYAKNTKVTGPEWTFFYFGWNMNTPYFSDVRVRRAMSYAFNHKEMLEDLCYGLYQPCLGIYHPESWMAPKNRPMQYQQDLDKAEDLLDEAGWVDSDGDGIRDKVVDGKRIKFEFDILVSNKPDRIAICNLLRENLESIGIICNVRPLEAAVMQERMFKKEFVAAFSGWGAGADPSTSDNIWETGAPRNFVGFSNKEVDELFKQGEREFDREKRAAIYGRIAEIIYDEQPYTFLYNMSSFYGFNKQLRGYMFSPRGPFGYSPGFGSVWVTK